MVRLSSEDVPDLTPLYLFLNKAEETYSTTSQTLHNSARLAANVLDRHLLKADNASLKMPRQPHSADHPADDAKPQSAQPQETARPATLPKQKGFLIPVLQIFKSATTIALLLIEARAT